MPETEAEALAALAALAQAPDPVARAQLVVAHACTLPGMDAAALYWWDADTATLHPLADTYAGASHPLPVFYPGQGIVGQVFQRGTPVVVDDYATWEGATSWSSHYGAGSALAVPLSAGGGVVGVLVAHRAQLRRITPEDVRLLSVLAAQLAPDADTLRWYAQAERRRAQSEVVADLVRQGAAESDVDRIIALVAAQASRLLGADYVTLALSAPDGTTSVPGVWGCRSDAWRALRYSPGKGAAGRVLAGPHTLVVERLGENPDIPPDEFRISRSEGGRTVLSTTLVSHDRALGALVAGWRSDVSLAPEQVALAETLASYAATIIDNARARADAAARAAELSAVIAQMPGGVLVTDAAGRVRLANDAVQHIFGVMPDPAHAPDELAAAAHLHDAETGRELPPEATPLGRALQGETVQGQELLLRRAHEADDRWLRACATPLRDEQGSITGAIGIISDVTREHALLRQLAASEAQLRTVYDTMACGIVVQDAAGKITDANEAAQHILGLPLEQLRGRTLPQTHRGAVRPDGSEVPLAERPSQVVLDTHGPQRKSIFGITRMDGQRRWLQVETVPVLGDGALQQVITSFIDITERQQAAEALEHQALHDTLTGLPNRTLLYDRMEQVLAPLQHLLAGTARSEQGLALLLLDLDRFKEVNDTFGHHHGDLLLQQVARRLTHVLRPTDTVARLGGDEFAVLLPGADLDGAVLTAHKVCAALDAPFVVEGQALHVGGSIGIALCPEHGLDAAALLRRADVAMYVAKRGGGGAPAVYTPEQDSYTPERQMLIADLRRAIAHDELVLHYQPQVAIDTGRVSGVEALVRWLHPRRGLVQPDLFIPLAEQAGLITPLTLWVLEAALRQCRDWQRAGRPLNVAVNLSATNLHDPHLPDTIARLLRSYAVPANRLRLEVTESVLMADAARAQDVLTRLADLGVGLSVDDYGTGYSSLAYLKRLPVDELKIDRSFVQYMGTEGADTAIVASTIGLGHSLGLQVVAEGVEDRATWDTLLALGCDAVQGYYLSRPLPAEDLEQWLCDSAHAVA